MKSFFVIIFTFVICVLCSCSTTKDLEDIERGSLSEINKDNNTDTSNSVEEPEIKEDTKQIVYIERPVYIPADEVEEAEIKKITGIDAVTESLKQAVITPEQYKQGTFFYQYNENQVYEVYAQPYHLTDIALERGEVVSGTPLLSEDEAVWELTAGVAKDQETGEDIQHLFIKPAYSALDSTLVIITDRRVYHFRIKSFKDTHMAMVKFTYPQTKNVWAKKIKNEESKKTEDTYMRISKPEFLSFDYKVTSSIWRRPEFMPTHVYDDGSSTYIQVDDIVLQKKLPVLFDENNKIVNYTVKKNVFVIPRLINSVTLQLGKQKVKITKKRTFEPINKTDEGESLNE